MACPVIQFIATCEISEVCADAQQTLQDILCAQYNMNVKHHKMNDATYSLLQQQKNAFFYRYVFFFLLVVARKGKIETVTIFTMLKIEKILSFEIYHRQKK